MPRTVVLTGPPGVGKTTLVKKVWEHVAERHKDVPLHGFITEEERSGGTRVGFKVVTTLGQEGPLASLGCKSSCRVGRYGVDVEGFEGVALPSLDLVIGDGSIRDGATAGLVLLDEIGKMEMFSDDFKTRVQNLLDAPGQFRVLTTIPIANKGNPIDFVEKIRKRSDISLIDISKGNRDQVLGEILQKLGF